VSDDPEVRAAVEAAREAQRLKSDPVVLEVVSRPPPLRLEAARDPPCFLSETDLVALGSPYLVDKALSSKTNLVCGFWYTHTPAPKFVACASALPLMQHSTPIRQRWGSLHFCVCCVVL
jgi:hypothetical protein